MNVEIFVSILLLIVSAILFLFPPKKKNYFYGYRTKKSMKTIKNWKFANRISAIIMMLLSTFNIIGFYIASLFTDEISKNRVALIFVVEFAILFYITEKKTAENEKKQ